MRTRVTQTGLAPVNGGELYYETLGEGEAILLIHAGVADHRMWDDQFYLFGIGHRVIRYDTRGFGKSRTESVEFSNRQDIVDLMDHLGVEKAHLIGNSRGGQIAIDFALEFPDRVHSLIPVAAGLSGFDIPEPTPDLKAEWDLCEQIEALADQGQVEESLDRQASYWSDGPRSTEGRCPAHVRAKVRQMIAENRLRVDGEPKAIVLDPPAEPQLETIAVPTLVVLGEFDELTEAAMGDEMAKRIPGARKVVFPAAHMVTMELPVEFNAEVETFYSRI
jgi:3-oxoadipate enol-lactonase